MPTLSGVTTLAIGHGTLATSTPQATTQAVGAQYDAAVMADKPTFYWPLNETSGAVRDLTGRAAASTVTSAKLGVGGAAGTAASFDGVSQRIQVPYTSAMRLPASFSAEVWAKLPSNPQTTGWPTIFSRGSVLGGHFGAAMWVSSDSTHTVHFKRNGIDVGTTKGLPRPRTGTSPSRGTTPPAAGPGTSTARSTPPASSAECPDRTSRPRRW